MAWYNNIKIMTKLLSGFVFVAIIAGIVGVVGILEMRAIDKADTFMYEKMTLGLNYVGKLGISYNRMRAELRALPLASTADVRRESFETIGKLRAEFEEVMKLYTNTFIDENDKKQYDELVKRYNDYIPLAEKVIRLTETGKMAEAESILLGEGLKVARDLQDKLQAMLAANEKAARETSEKNTALANRATVIMIATILIAMAVAILLGFSISLSIKRPVEKAMQFSRMISQGDFTGRIDLDQKDELGQLGASLNKAADSLEDLVANLVTASQNLAQAVEQISSGNQNLSQRTSEQASSLEEVASTIEEATANIKQNAENAIEANKLAGNSTKLAEDGGRITDEAVASINEINLASKKIGEITAVINEISFQTNLLALNAAVEAARAGEQGRGFAVVASEIRNLAQRSGNAAKEIADMIKDTVEKVANGTLLVNNSGESLKEIIKGVRDLNRFITEIAAASDEQMRGMDQINVAISEMDTMTQQNAALVEETASASEEMSNQAQELLMMTEKFTIRNETGRNKHHELHLRAANESLPGKSIGKLSHNKGNGNSGTKRTVDTIKKALERDGFEEF